MLTKCRVLHGLIFSVYLRLFEQLLEVFDYPVLELVSTLYKAVRLCHPGFGLWQHIIERKTAEIT